MEKELKAILEDYKKLKMRHSWPSAAMVCQLLDRLAILLEGKVPGDISKGNKSYNKK